MAKSADSTPAAVSGLPLLLFGSLLCGKVAMVAWAGGDGWRGLVHLVLYVLATLPGWSLGFWLFGRRHAAGWVAGGLLGYGVTAIALWAPMALGVASPLVLLTAWALAGLACWLAFARREALVPLKAWTRRDTAALVLVLLVVPLLVGVPFARIGEHGDDGTRHYRAYFTADFLWHIALTSELTHLQLPPQGSVRGRSSAALLLDLLPVPGIGGPVCHRPSRRRSRRSSG